MSEKANEMSVEELWNHEPGDILVTDESKLMIVSVESFEKGFKNFFGDNQPIEFLLVNVETGEMEAAIDKEDLDILWKFYDIKDIIKKKR